MAETKKSTFGLEKNIAATACYVLFWASGLVFFLAEKEDKDIRFHALQSILLFGAVSILMIFFSGLWFFGATMNKLLSLFCLVAWLVLMVKTYQGEKIKLPIIGEIAQKQANK